MGLLEEGVKVKERELNLLKDGYGSHHWALKEKNENIWEKTTKVKKIWVSIQKEISEIEKKLNAMNIEPEEPAGPIAETTEKVDIYAPVNTAKDKANQILKNLKTKLEKLQTGENSEEHFIWELPS